MSTRSHISPRRTRLYVYAGSLATTAADSRALDRASGGLRLALTVAGFAATVLIVELVSRSARRALDQEFTRSA